MKKGFKFSLLCASLMLGVASLSPVLQSEGVFFAQTSPVYISSLSQITNMSGNYIMTENTNIELDEVWTPIGTKDNPFKGTFDGNGCSYILFIIKIYYRAIIVLSAQNVL